MAARVNTLVEPHARSDRIAVVLRVAARTELDPDHELLDLLASNEEHANAITRRLVADEDPSQDG